MARKLRPEQRQPGEVENPECSACTREGEAAWYLNILAPHIQRAAMRGDAVESWIKAKRDEHDEASESWSTLDGLLDEYRLRADCGAPLDGPVPVEGGEDL
ncbi:hypothetical protein ACGF0J_14200 [Nonomuraea sp. NPDC047897]|uniref:hypothetical protein n=1 Tax=Nonomuraea sp. NPDC047897 TaxID=3364346 RepID=UPI003713439F